MTEETTTAPGGELPLASTPAETTPLSRNDAFAALKQRREAPVVEAPVKETVEPAPESPAKGDAGPDESQTPGEEPEAADPAEKQPIEPPRSWPKDKKEAFKLLPPEIQQLTADMERTREAEFRRGQNEVAEQRKAAQAERDQAEQTKQQYEKALPQLQAALQAQYATEFGDIKDWNDVQTMAREDPLRYNQWHAKQEQLKAVQQEAHASEQRKTQEQHAAFEKYASEQDKAALERVPDLANPERAPKVREQAAKFLEATGFTQEELSANWQGQRGISLRDARMQELIWKAASYDAAKAAVKTAVPAKPVAPVQRPGVSTSKAEAKEADTRSLLSKLDRSGSQKDAFAALQAMRAAKG